MRMPPLDYYEAHNNQPESGWTFIEVIIVITIIIILTGAVGIVGTRYVDRARTSAAKNEISSLGVGLDSYYLDCGSYPTVEQGLAALWKKPNLSPVSPGWSGPYLSREDFTDPWGREYIYENPGPNGLPYALSSLGADGQEGGEDKNADILSWKE